MKYAISSMNIQIFDRYKRKLQSAVFSRRDDIQNKQWIQDFFESEHPPASFFEQLHGTEIEIIHKDHAANWNDVERRGDVLITNVPGIPLMIRIADCASVMLFDPVQHVVANIHAGWRGISARIIHKTIARLEEHFGSHRSDIVAAISPMLGPCCSRFSDPFNELPKFMYHHINEENFVNLWAALEEHLHECGIPKEQIENPRICTFCHPEDFFSYRREGNAGRFATAIMMI